MDNKANLIKMKDLQSYIHSVNANSGFEHTILTDETGLPIVSSFQDLSASEVEAAIIAMVQKTLRNLGNELEMTTTKEIILLDAEGRKLVIRPFHVGETEFTLAVLVPCGKNSFRRATRNIVNTIKTSWVI